MLFFKYFTQRKFFAQTITSHKWMCVFSERITITLYYTGFQYTSFSCIQNACTTRISWFYCLIKNTLLFLRYMDFVWNACYLKGLHITFVSQCIRFLIPLLWYMICSAIKYFHFNQDTCHQLLPHRSSFPYNPHHNQFTCFPKSVLAITVSSQSIRFVIPCDIKCHVRWRCFNCVRFI